MQTIDEADYRIQVKKQAKNLADKIKNQENSEPQDLIVDILNGHKWFKNNGNKKLNGSDYGAIVSDFNLGGDVERYRDPETLTSSFDFTTVLERMAFAQFEADILWLYEIEFSEN